MYLTHVKGTVGLELHGFTQFLAGLAAPPRQPRKPVPEKR